MGYLLEWKKVHWPTGSLVIPVIIVPSIYREGGGN
jgi:hypothetical protein